MSRKYKDGIWEGFYKLNGKPHFLKIEMYFQMDGVNSGLIHGSGVDVFLGSFNIIGNFVDKAPFSCEFRFEFPSDTSIEMKFSGWRESDKGGFFGEWNGTNGSGSFAFSPSKEFLEKDVYLPQVKSKLLEMGFSEQIIEKALEVSTELDEALNWISKQTTNNLLSVSTICSAEINEHDLCQLVDMGFNVESARNALIEMNGNLEDAANMLFEMN